MIQRRQRNKHQITDHKGQPDASQIAHSPLAKAQKQPCTQPKKQRNMNQIHRIGYLSQKHKETIAKPPAYALQLEQAPD